MRRLAGLLLVLVLSGCSASGADAPTGPLLPPPTPTPTPTPEIVSETCRTATSGLVDKLGQIDSRLNVGLVFRDYSERVGDAQVEYDAVVGKVSRLRAVMPASRREAAGGRAQPLPGGVHRLERVHPGDRLQGGLDHAPTTGVLGERTRAAERGPESAPLSAKSPGAAGHREPDGT